MKRRWQLFIKELKHMIVLVCIYLMLVAPVQEHWLQWLLAVIVLSCGHSWRTLREKIYIERRITDDIMVGVEMSLMDGRKVVKEIDNNEKVHLN